MTCNGTPVWVYQGKELKVFASEEAAQKWFDENDPGGGCVQVRGRGRRSTGADAKRRAGLLRPN